ncbi:MAG: UbiA family prenyltransferase [Candidatus Hodarchaeales archaeon]|jgi:1,4-dihydroxy-2-naphthoate octaprenyltransferase
MTETTMNKTNEQQTLPASKAIGFIKLTRPQFLIAYLIIALGALVQGLIQELTLNLFHAVFAIFAALISAIGVHYRDEAGDWASGYDEVIGGMGIIRDGILTESTVRNAGRIITVFAILTGILQATLLFLDHDQLSLFLIGIPILIVIIFVNFLTEEIPLGHEIFTTMSYLAAFYWVYLSQNWMINSSVILYSIFIFLLVFALVPYQDIADIESDKKTGKKTLSVKLGIDGMGHLCIFAGLIALLFLYASMLI